MLAANARQAHLEMGDTPIVDKGAYAMIGSDDFFLRKIVRAWPLAEQRDFLLGLARSPQALFVAPVFAEFAY